VVVGRRFHVRFGPEVAELGLLKLQRLDRAAVVGRGHRLHLHAQVLLELGKNRRPAAGGLRGGLRGRKAAQVLPCPPPSPPAGAREQGCQPDGDWTHECPPYMAARRTRAERTSMHIPIATISMITVAASPSLKDRIVPQR